MKIKLSHVLKAKGIKKVKLSKDALFYQVKLGLRDPLQHNLETNGLQVTSEPPPMAGQAGCLQGQDRSAATHRRSNHGRRCLIRLSCDNRCTHYTAPLANGIKW
ncbi:hypothetical protein J6590_035661 [Homalodisca vitripennis]|nr:hypothetical protein J6590_035661 [Homalodisca vitripennis]